MWKAKDGVDLSTLRPEIARLEPTISDVYRAFGGKVPVVTSTNADGYDVHGRKIHRADSFHYRDAAIDLRVWHVGGAPTQRSLWIALRALVEERFPGLYQVLFEGSGTSNAHIHIEPSDRLASLMFNHSQEAIV